jgi:hypothetical protein
MVGGDPGDNALFLWSSSDSAKVMLTAAGASASLRAIEAGTAYITVRNSRYPDSYTKTILVLVEEDIKEGCYTALAMKMTILYGQK